MSRLRSRSLLALPALAVLTTACASTASPATHALSRAARHVPALGARGQQDPAAVLNGLPELPTTTAGERVFAAASACGVERWSIKTGMDSAARTVNLTSVQPSTIARLRTLAQPTSLPPSSRIGMVERTVYRVDGTLTSYKLESDNDLHLVLTDATGRTLVVEIPHPDCISARSPWRTRIAAARAAFYGRYRPTSSFQRTHKHVVVAGVGFFDRLHGQTGMSPNGLELHPVLAITF